MAKFNKDEPIKTKNTIDWEYIIIVFFAFCLGVTLSHKAAKHISWMATLNALLCVSFLVSGLFMIQKGVIGYREKKEIKKFNSDLLFAFISTTSALLIYIVWIVSTGNIYISSVGLLLFMFITVFFEVIQSIKNGYQGWREFVLSFFASVLVPAFAYSYYGNHYSLDFIGIVITLFLLVLCHMIIRKLKVYDPNRDPRTSSFLEIVGWKRGLQVHHIGLLSSYLIALIINLFTKSWYLFWPMLTSLPLAIIVIALSWRLEQGRKPSWILLHATSLATVLLSIYMLTITNIIRWIS